MKNLLKKKPNRVLEKKVVTKLKDGDKNWKVKCSVCGSKPTVHPTELCGPCCFGEAETLGGNW